MPVQHCNLTAQVPAKAGRELKTSKKSQLVWDMQGMFILEKEPLKHVHAKFRF